MGAFHGKWLVTAGPTREAIDPVRFLSNHSTGKMGYAIAAELARRGAEVVLVSGPTTLDTPAGVRRVDVVSAEEMYSECTALWPEMDGAVMCAAVADYTPVEVSDVKLKKNVTKAASSQEITLRLRPTKDIAAELGRTKRPGRLLVGFALETDNEEANALSKLHRKNLDLIVLNSMCDAGAGFGGDTNLVTIFERAGRAEHAGLTPGSEAGAVQQTLKTTYPLETKSQVAARIVDRLKAMSESKLSESIEFAESIGIPLKNKI